MKRTTRALLASIFSAGLLLLQASPAGAHASMRASEPAGGSALREAPGSVKITYTEPPDPALSSVKVTGRSGSFEQGRARLAPGDEMSLILDLKPLPQGSYNVTWRTVSKADGHSSAGSFNFGVGEPPDTVVAPAPDQPGFNSLGAAGRWLFYLGSWAFWGHRPPPCSYFEPAPPRIVPSLGVAGGWHSPVCWAWAPHS